MEVILKKDLINLGYKNEIVNVKPGYARNYLIPQGLAIAATKSNRKMLEENLRQAAHKIEKIKNDAQNIANRLEKEKLVIPAKTGTSGKLFGSVTNQQIAAELTKKGYEIDRRKVTIEADVRLLGEYTAKVELYKEIYAEIPFEVVKED